MLLVSEIYKDLLIRESIDKGSQSILNALSSNQNIKDRIHFSIDAIFYAFFVATSLITVPLSLIHRSFIVIKKPKDTLSFNETLKLFQTDETMQELGSFTYPKIHMSIRYYKKVCKYNFKKEKGIKNRFKVSLLTVVKELSKPLSFLAYSINLFSLGVFHAIGSLFSTKCDSNKGIYVVNSIQTPALFISQLIFMPFAILLKLRKENS